MQRSVLLIVGLGCLVVAQKKSDDYYAGIDASATNDDLKGQLKELINPHTVYSYDDVWGAFPSIDVYLPNYPCDTNTSYIPDIYSSYCWEPDVTAEGCLLYTSDAADE